MPDTYCVPGIFFTRTTNRGLILFYKIMTSHETNPSDLQFTIYPFITVCFMFFWVPQDGIRGTYQTNFPLPRSH